MFGHKREQTLCIGVVGLGLIGGSFAKALKRYTDHIVYGCDIDAQTIHQAITTGAIDEEVVDNDLSECDLVFIALYPRQTVDFVKNNIIQLKPGSILVDFCGIKRYVVENLSEFCRENEICYVGGHPMAGKECWGYSGSDCDLYRGASMILTPDEQTPDAAMELLTNLFADLGFSRITRTTPEAHDSMIAFTSQLAHVLSNAYVKSPRAKLHKGFSAGSYKDLSRVAKLNPQMWTELFLENADDLADEINTLIMHLGEYRDAILADDAEQLFHLLDDGRQIKEELDG